MNNNLLFFDCETGGLDPSTSDMIEVGAILTDPTGKTVLKEYSAKVLPNKPVAPEAAAINGYDAKMWSEQAVNIDVAMHNILEMARNAMVVAHNTPFDWSFLMASLQGKRWPGRYYKVDTMALSMPLLLAGKIDNLKLDTLARHFGLVNEKAHSALGDVRVCRELYLKLMGLYAPLFST